jgi:predicted PurR-regulated permease PerM
LFLILTRCGAKPELFKHSGNGDRRNWSRALVRTKEILASSKSLMVIAFVLAIAALYFGRTVFIPLALALVLCFLLTPFVIILEKIRFGRVPAVIAVVVLSLGLVGIATWGVAGQLVEIMVHFPDYKANLDVKIQSLHSSKTSNFSRATASVQELNKELAAVPGEVAGRVQAKDQGTTRPARPIQVQFAPPASSLVQDLGALLGPLSGPGETAVIVIIFTMFMLVKREDLRNRAIRLAGRGQLSVMTQAFDDASRRLSRYLLLQFLVNAAYGSCFGLGLYLVGVPHALLWGVVAAFLRFVPYIGTFVAAALPIAMAIAVFPGWRQAGLAFAVFVVLELIVSNVVEPMLYGAHTGISSLAILVAAVFWAMLWGPVGLILSTPLTVCLVVLGRYVPQLKFLDVVLGDEPALPPEQLFYQRLLAMDQEEARSIAEAHLKDKGNKIESFYESIIIPALRLAEQDYYIEALDDDTRRFVLRSTRELIEDIGDGLIEDSAHASANENGNENGNGKRDLRSLAGSSANIACIPVRGGSDELVAMMLAQLLRSAGYRALQVRPGALEEMLEEVSQQESSIVCVSCLPPFATASARSLCKRLKARFPGMQIIIGLWHLNGGVGAARERLGAGCPDIVMTTLSEALAEVQRLTDPEAAAEPPIEPEKAATEPEKALIEPESA